MAFIAPSSINSPEQQELEDKRQQLEALEAEFAARQLEYSTLAGEIAAFRNRYYLRVGSLYARLDTLRAEIREAEARRAPQDTAAHEEAMKARRQAEGKIGTDLFSAEECWNVRPDLDLIDPDLASDTTGTASMADEAPHGAESALIRIATAVPRRSRAMQSSNRSLPV